MAVSRSERIFNNTAWLGLDVLLAAVFGLLTTIPVNRIIGAERLGYFTYISFLSNAGSMVAAVGIPVATRKYMAEYLGSGQIDIAREVFFQTLRIQSWIGLALVIVGEVLVFRLTDRSYWVSSALLVLSQAPRMLIWIPSLANEAAERMRSNIPATMVSQVLLSGGVLLSLWRGWDLNGIAAANGLCCSIEFIIKYFNVIRWLGKGPRRALPPELKTRMVAFGGYGMVLQLLNLIVWDRSDLIVLKLLDSNKSHWTFFSLAISLTDRVISALRPFGHAVAMTVVAEYGRERKRPAAMTALSLHYIMLFGAPCLLCLAAISKSVIITLYGVGYQAVAAPLMVASILGIPKLLLMPVQGLLQAYERQRSVASWFLLCAVLNVGLDIALILPYGALGATIANGTAQAIAVGGLWWQARKVTGLQLPIAKIRVGLLVGIGSAVAASGARLVPVGAAAQVLFGIVLWGGTFMLLFRAMGVVTSEDEERVQVIVSRLPGSVGRSARVLVRYLRKENGV